MTKKTKIICACAAGLTALAIVGSIGIASFKDKDTKEETSKSDSIVNDDRIIIEVSDLEIENANNISPGDEVVNALEGTSHDFKFTVTNSGNKSVVTRNTITLTIKKDSNVLDADVLALYENGTELVEKFAQVEGKDYFIPYEKGLSGKIEAIRYVVTGASLNGTGIAAEIENDIKSNKQDYSYDLSLAHGATEGYQLADITIDIEVQAMPYHKDKDSKWETLFSDTMTAKISA